VTGELPLAGVNVLDLSRPSKARTAAPCLPNLVVDFDTLVTMTAKGPGTTDYRRITQEQINLFTDATDNQQWIRTAALTP
jgi:acyl dehydratase